jgi:hypothetical protein
VPEYPDVTNYVEALSAYAVGHELSRIELLHPFLLRSVSPRCQTGGRVLADRALSRLLKEDWPRRIEDLEEKRRV